MALLVLKSDEAVASRGLGFHVLPLSILNIVKQSSHAE